MGKVTKAIRTAVCIKANWICFYCSQHVGEFAYVDHVTPSSQSGTNIKDNLVACCPSCNSRKGSRNLEEYRTFFYNHRHPRGSVLHKLTRVIESCRTQLENGESVLTDEELAIMEFAASRIQLEIQRIFPGERLLGGKWDFSTEKVIYPDLKAVE